MKTHSTLLMAALIAAVLLVVGVGCSDKTLSSTAPANTLDNGETQFVSAIGTGKSQQDLPLTGEIEKFDPATNLIVLTGSDVNVYVDSDARAVIMPDQIRMKFNFGLLNLRQKVAIYGKQESPTLLRASEIEIWSPQSPEANRSSS